MGRMEIFLIALGVVSLLSLGAPELGFLPMITIIGIPLAFAYWFTPAVFVVVLTAYIIYRFLPLSGMVGGAVSLIFAGVLLAVPPYLLNLPIQTKADSLVRGDLNRLKLPLKTDVLANRETYRFRKDQTRCDGFCLHALLSGTAKRFLVAHMDNPSGEIVSDQDVTAFRLESRDVCPPLKLRSGEHKLAFPRSKGDTTRQADAVETLKLRAAEGICLVSEPARLGEADLVISRGQITPGVHARARTSYDFFKDTVSAKRTSVHQRTADAGFTETYRHTEVRYQPFGWVLVPGVSMSGGFNFHTGWWRREAKLNVKSRYHNPSEWGEFLTGPLGLKLQLEGEDTKQRTLVRLRRRLDEGTTPNAAERELFVRYFNRLQRRGPTRIERQDFDLASRMLANVRYPVPPKLHHLVGYAEREAGPDDLKRFAGLLIDRLIKRGQQPGTDRDEQLRHLVTAVGKLPDSMLMARREEMLALTRSPKMQVRGFRALQQLSAYGEAAVPALLGLMEVGLEGGKKFYVKHQFQNPYLGGLGGLCRAGHRAQSALEPLRRMTDAGRLPQHAGYGRLLFTTLLRLGEDPQKVRTLFDAAAKSKAQATDRAFERLKAGAMSNRPPCYA
ncbi:MAG: hypothetical protein AAGF81_03755 [Pseudomonadota bacterium]